MKSLLDHITPVYIRYGKHEYYAQPNKGITGNIEEAGEYSLYEAKKLCIEYPNHLKLLYLYEITS